LNTDDCFSLCHRVADHPFTRMDAYLPVPIPTDIVFWSFRTLFNIASTSAGVSPNDACANLGVLGALQILGGSKSHPVLSSLPMLTAHD
jgi:hypothetical protein